MDSNQFDEQYWINREEPETPKVTLELVRAMINYIMSDD